MSSTFSVAESMTDPALIHGGRLDEVMARFGGALADWVDLPTGINPWPWPVAARRCYGAPNDARIVVGNGSQALIQALPLCLEPARVAIVGPTYREHELCWSLAGHRVVSAPDLAAAGGADVVVTRPFPERPGWLRPGLPATADASRRLSDALGSRP